VLEALGVHIGLDAPAAARVLRDACITFLFAPNFHPAMRHAGPVRRELAVPSVMNLLGPLANPARVRRQVVGVADPDRAPLVAGALARLGAEHALVVHGRIGMDEISPRGITDVWEVRSGRVWTWELDPATYGLAIPDATALHGGVRGLEPDPAAGFAVEPFHCGAGTLHERDDGLAAVGLVALVHDDEVAVLDVLVDHRLPADLEHVAAAAAGDELIRNGDGVV